MRKLSTKPGLTTVAIVAIVAGLLVAGTGVAYVATDGFGRNDDAASQSTAESSETTDTPAATTDDRSLLRQALAGGDSIRCDYTAEEGSGTAYISDEQQMRADFSHPEDGNGHFIKDGQSFYIWTDGEDEGIIFTADADSSEYEEQYDYFDPEDFEDDSQDDSYQIDCQRDDFDQDLLTPPSDVEFRDFSQLFNPSAAN